MIKSFFAALSFISRLPVPARLSQGLEIEQYQRSIVTFPLVGLLLGAIAGAVALLLQPWWRPAGGAVRRAGAGAAHRRIPP